LGHPPSQTQKPFATTAGGQGFVTRGITRKKGGCERKAGKGRLREVSVATWPVRRKKSCPKKLPALDGSSFIDQSCPSGVRQEEIRLQTWPPWENHNSSCIALAARGGGRSFTRTKLSRQNTDNILEKEKNWLCGSKGKPSFFLSKKG